MSFPSEKIVEKYDTGDYVGDAEMLEIYGQMMNYAQKMYEWLYELQDEASLSSKFSHAGEVWLGHIPILYADEVAGYIVFEDHGPVLYKGKLKEK